MGDPVERVKKYFVGHSLTPENVKDLRRVIDGVFSPRGYVPYYADKPLQVQSLLFNICQKIYLADFCVFDLSLSSPNVYLELGIALGFNRPVILIARDIVALPSFLTSDIVMRYTDYADVEAQLSLRCEQGFPNPLRAESAFCLLCSRVCKGLLTYSEEESYLVVDASRLLWRDVMRSLTTVFSERSVIALRLTDLPYEATLCDIRSLVQSARFSIAHLGVLSDEASYLALGLTIGLRQPWLLLAKDSDETPSNLRGIDQICYSTYADLEELLETAFNSPLGAVLLPRIGRTGSLTEKTQEVGLSFWMQLDHWIDSLASQHIDDTSVHGRLRLIRYQDTQLLMDRPIPSGGMIIGRDPTCDIQIDDPKVTAKHFQVWMDKGLRCFIQDLDSKNGTYLNGERLPPRRKHQMQIGDRISVSSGRFVVWDDRGLPLSSPRSQTGYLGPRIKIDIQNILPPAHISARLDYWVTLNFIHPDGENITIVETQSYYPFGAILEKLCSLHELESPAKNYRLKRSDQYIDSDETPLGQGLSDGAALQIARAEQINYELGLKHLKEFISTHVYELMKDFYPLEHRLLENLSRERKYVSDDSIREERVQIVDELSRLADRAGSQQSFNDLCKEGFGVAQATASDGRAGRRRLDRSGQDLRTLSSDTEEKIHSLQHELAELQINLRLIQERKAEFVIHTDIPLHLIKEERRLLDRIAELERQLDVQSTAHDEPHPE
jgi:hypothetical protein